MSFSARQCPSLRPFFFRSLVVWCFLVMLFMFYNSDIKFPTFGILMKKGEHPCPAVLCADEAQTQDSNPNVSIELHSDSQKIQTAAVHTEPDTIVLLWMWPIRSGPNFDCSIFNITGCHFTKDKTLYQKAHGVLFHHRNIPADLSGFPKEPRPFFQKWVWFNMESPSNSAQIPELNHLFNLTCNYRLDSNIPVPQGKLVPVTSEDKSFKLPAKDKLVCWIVSDWKPQHTRVGFYNELKNHIKINTYGKAFGQSVSEQDYEKIVSSCKFYLSFENSVHKDYITEKLYRPLSLGTVPVVLGPPRHNYEDHVPGDSFIHFKDFSTPKELAERLLYLDRNNAEYMRFFHWKNKYKVKRAVFAREHACKTCSYLQKNKDYQAFHDLNTWYWG